MYVSIFIYVCCLFVCVYLLMRDLIIYSDPPVFVGSNETTLRQLRQGENHTLYCNISSANPTPHLKLIRPNNTSKNVEFKVIRICSTFQNGHLSTK